jgi:formylglycine-generating enzyme required for sulfatase activity
VAKDPAFLLPSQFIETKLNAENRSFGAAAMSRKSLRAVIGLFLALWAGFLVISSSAQETGKKLALLVGIDKYPSGSGFSSLPFPQRDVDQLAQLLRDSGYRPEHVRVLTPEKGFKDDPRFLPSGRNVLTEFRLLANDRKPQDSLLIALVGHGLTRKIKIKDAAGNEVERLTGFFCPQDADIRDTKSMISLDDLYGELDQSKAGVKVMFVDACRDNPTEGNTGAIPFAPPSVPPSVAALFSCSDGEVAWEDAELGGGHGVFFHFLIEGLKSDADGNRDGKVSLLELVAYTEDKVPDFVSHRRGRRQMPVLLGRTVNVTLLDLARGTAAPEFITTRIGQIKLKRIPAGSFLMGSPDDDKEAFGREKPQHRVRISKPFYVGVYEVTQAQYEAVMGNNPSYFSPNGGGKEKVAGQLTDQHPVKSISWLDAVTFCNKLSEREGRKPFYEIDGKEVRVPDWSGPSYRLPTEAEWEYACRGNSSTPMRYSFGDDAAELGEYAWFGEDFSKGATHPVGQKKPNGFGLHDMHGNVWEWCWDWFGEDYYKQSPAADPTGPEVASDRVYRGGGWYNLPRYCRSAYRDRDAPGYRFSFLGFRMALVQSGR